MESYLSTIIYVVQMLFYVSCVSEEATLQSLPLTESPTLKKKRAACMYGPLLNCLKEKKGQPRWSVKISPSRTYSDETEI
jgi:hypothetical protein